jgi:hypothetical protein
VGGFTPPAFFRHKPELTKGVEMTVWSVWDEDTRKCLLWKGTDSQAQTAMVEAGCPAGVASEWMARANDGSEMALVVGGFSILAEDADG